MTYARTKQTTTNESRSQPKTPQLTSHQSNLKAKIVYFVNMISGESPSPTKILVDRLPSQASTIFRDSSFFKRNRLDCVLPSPAQIRADWGVTTRRRPPPAYYPSLNLVVKYGTKITIAEGQCLWTLHHLKHRPVPVPEVYGWVSDEDQVFIYMEHVSGVTLEHRWDSLSKEERNQVCEQLRVILNALRQIEHDPKEHFIGHVGRQPLQDIIFDVNAMPVTGPFSSVPEFHNWLSDLTKRLHPDPSLIPEDPMRYLMPDDARITFTHGDLHPSNIILSPENPCRVVAIIDWHQSGWYPAYWEYCKAAYTAVSDGEWESQYLPKLLEVPNCLECWNFYAMTLGY